MLLRLEDGGYYALDEVGARIWELCDGHRAVGEIVALLCLEFDAPEETVRADVLEFIGDLRRERLLVVEPASRTRALAELHSPAESLLLVRVGAFAATVPLLMRLPLTRMASLISRSPRRRTPRAAARSSASRD